MTPSLALTNVGHRRALELSRGTGLWDADPGADDHLLRLLRAPAARLPASGASLEHDLLRRGFVREVDESVTAARLRRDVRANPLEQISAVALEMTTRCDFRCDHCYNASVPEHTERDLDRLLRTTDLLASMGVRRFAFIGGEVTKYADGWLTVARSVRARGAEVVGVLTNGWWLGRGGFEAAGERYPSVRRYLDELRDHGVTHVVFSLDGPASVHDRNRHHPGLYGRIVAEFAEVRAASLVPRVSVLLRNNGLGAEGAWIAGLARQLYPEARDLDDGSAAAVLLGDPTNIASNFMEHGRGSGSFDGYAVPLACFRPEHMRCAGFYRPSPKLTVKAGGEIATCRLGCAGEGYGNIHQTDPVDILNRMQDAFVYRLHAERLIGGYRELMDREVFGHYFGSVCAVRAIVTLIARKMEEQGVDPGDRARVARINREVASLTGHAARDGD